MTKTLKMLAAQLNPVVGDIKGNKALAEAAHAEATAKHVDLLVLSELFILGYPAEDLVLKPAAVEHSMQAVHALTELTQNGPAILIGSPWAEDGKLFNSILLLQDGAIRTRYDKRELPNYGVFDEKRIFDAGEGAHETVTMNGIQVGLAICEDIWYDRVPGALSEAGAEVLLVPNASPWRRTVNVERHTTFSAWAKTGVPYLFVNQVGGQDELVFDGASYAVDFDGAEHQLLGDFVSGSAVVTYNGETHRFEPADDPAKLTSGWEAEYRAATLALGDYVNKNRFPGVVLGLSGGIDSALTAAMAVDALGPERVWCVMMPSKYTSSESLEDAKACAEALGVRYDSINIAPGVDAMDEMLGAAFAETEADTTEENIQSRLRGVTLMALSNKFGHMVVTTGNKSEMAVGYATLYGDMCGGYNALKDFYKTEVFALSRWRNTAVPLGALGPGGEVIPERIITKPPSAELREDQKDEDSLPPYEALDDILRGLVDLEEDVDDILARGHDEATVRRIEHLLYVAEYKRRQAPPGVKVGSKNFGRDRRYPITNRFRDD
ncbi:MAG: NAD+ synthase [Hyphomonadaceae bacterium]|nr:NAD+ synthase [Hyphomonadaceae bacterium]